MKNDPRRGGEAVAAGRVQLELFRQAAIAGRSTLDAEELGALFAGLKLRYEPDALPDMACAALRIELVNTREFGMVISAGAGGVDAELGESHFIRDRACVHACADLTDAADFLSLFKRTYAYRRLAALAVRGGLQPPDGKLSECFDKLLRLAVNDVAGGRGSPQVLQRLELNPVYVEEQLTIRAAHCSFGPPAVRRPARPLHKIDKLIHPQSIGVIGVSSGSMNFGRIIVRNLMGSGYAAERMVIIRPGETEIDGVKCVASLSALEHKLDLLIVALGASAVYGLVDEIIRTDCAESVMLIPGGLGETEASREPARALAERIDAAHRNPGGGPVFLGANCLGVVSHAGSYDSWFIPLERLPKPRKKPVRNSVMLSQSGAFMITRISRNPWLDPEYMLAVGNQTDLTHGDMLSYFADLPGIETIGIYIEGFRDLDGGEFVKAVRKAVLGGRQVVVYKSGRTASGASGVMGHTASVAGAYSLFDSVVRHAGAIVAEDLTAFDDLFYIAGALHHKKIGGRRLGAISGAGFEVVAAADSIEGDTLAMELGGLAPQTVKRIESILTANKLDSLVEVRNPIDINPGADDEAHMEISAAFLQDPGIDAVVVGLDPTAPAVRALESSGLRPGHDISHPKSTVKLMPQLVRGTEKPVIGIVDGGTLYDAMCGALMDQGVCVFRNCAGGTRALVRYIEARLYAVALKDRQQTEDRT